MFLAVLWSLTKLMKGLCTRIFCSALLRISQDSDLTLNFLSRVQRLMHRNFQISLMKHLYLEYQVCEIFLHVMYLTYPNTRLWDLRFPQQCCWRFRFSGIKPAVNITRDMQFKGARMYPVASLCLLVHLYASTRKFLNNCHEILYWGVVLKSDNRFKFCLKLVK